MYSTNVCGRNTHCTEVELKTTLTAAEASSQYVYGAIQLAIRSLHVKKTCFEVHGLHALPLFIFGVLRR